LGYISFECSIFLPYQPIQLTTEAEPDFPYIHIPGGPIMWQPEKQDTRRSMQSLSTLSKDVPKSPNSLPESTEAVVAFVGKGVEFKGTISYSGAVRIDGFLDGEIHTDGTLLVGEEAVITAKVSAGTIVCMGKITGDVTASEKVQLLAPAALSGGVKTPIISIEDGVFFNGTLEMTQAVREVSRETPREVSRETPHRSVEDPEASASKRAAA
jgi:cytoskeletal protein CcmA (bactofilin family)